jgi:prepilin-type N-terminal cleavage/methylation domain-containing protein
MDIQRKENNIRGRAGFTLIEILITIVILSTGIVVILHAFEVSMTGLARARDVLSGTILCQNKITDIKSDIILGKAPNAVSGGAFDSTFNDFRWEVESGLMPRSVKKPDSSDKGKDKGEETGVDLYKVKVSVWRNGYPDERQETVTFLKF